MPSSELVHVPQADTLAALSAPDVVAAFLAGRNPRTIDAYARDLGDFARFLGQGGPSEAVSALLSLAPGQANAIALAYRSALTERGLSPATIARRLAALRSVVKLARTLGRVS